MIPEQLLEKGLTNQEAEKRLKEYGKNVLPEKPPLSDLSIFISQLKSPMVYILLVAGVVTFLLGEFADTLIIALAVFINTILGFFQERKANRSLEALKKMIHPEAKVVREGKVVKIGSESVVPGDLVVLHQGDKIPADGKVLDSTRFLVNEAMLTGESVPVKKEEDQPVYMGTVVVGGNCFYIVEKTGAGTEMGKIATSVSGPDEDTPLRRQLTKFSHYLSYLVGGLILIVFIIGILRKMNIFEIFTTSVALAVSSIPEGLLVGLTVVLAIGMQRILARKGLVRNLVSAETLGGVTTICVDKTGTLTLGKMQVTNVEGDEKDLAFQISIANDLDDPIVVSGFEWAKSVDEKYAKLSEKHVRVDSIPFSSDARFFASLNKFDENQNVLFINGAPEVVLANCEMDEEQKHSIYQKIDELSAHGKRLIGLARKFVPNDMRELHTKDTKSGLEWVGILAFDDPIRADVKDSLNKTKNAGIKLIVITGDYAKTAVSVLNVLGLGVTEDNIILGDHLEEMSDEEISEKLKNKSNVKLFARTKPDQKLRIVDLLKAQGEVVAMMGDGVNDAPALSKADIGIVVGDATEVAKETADLVLLDSSFSTIVAAVEEGRGIFNNIRKIILYLLGDAFEEIVLVLSSLIFNFPLPITAAQILWINLVSDGFPHLALTVDPKSKEVMSSPPRKSNEPLISGWMNGMIIVGSLVAGIYAFLLYYFILKFTGDVVLARSATFATVGMDSMMYVFSIRSLKEKFKLSSLFNNVWLLVAVAAGVFLQVLPFVNGTVGDFLEVKPLGILWVFVIIGTVLLFLSMEIFKIFLDWREQANLRKNL